jgi:U3 small nucleolar RNA-associated protein 14
MMDAEPGAEDDSGSEEESGDDEEEDEDEDENPLASEDEEEDEDGDALSKLDDFIGTLETKKRKASELGSVSEQNVRKRRLTERTELGNEGEFSAPIGSEDGKNI